VLYEETMLIDILVELIDATWANTKPRDITNKILNYQKQRKICVELGVDVTKYNKKVANYTKELNSCPLFLE